MLGGWLVENFSWRWVFLINLPVAGGGSVHHRPLGAGEPE